MLRVVIGMGVGVGFAITVPDLTAAESAAPEAAAVFIHPSILGASSCSTSGCHGGAGEKSLQYAVWSQRDVHSRSFATLTTARSARMAEALGIADPATSLRCTTCHAPLQSVKSSDPALLAPEARVTEGVSCASCHGADGDWLRSHTRPDFTHADKVAAGLKDLRDLHARATSCVACHQNIDPALVETGRHPRLVFELDGQTASEPRHWRETAGYNGAQAWQVGQAVALREVSWALQQRAATAAEIPRWQALLWVLQRAGDADNSAQAVALRAIPPVADAENFARAQSAADALARALASGFDAASVPARLKKLAATHAEFADTSVDRTQQACRAERLVLAFDRLLAALPAAARPPGASARLDALFARSQSIPDFAPAAFARELEAFAQTLP